MITLIFPTQGNPMAAKTTLDSFRGIVDEVIIGDVMVFPTDRLMVHSYESEYNIKVIPLPFDYIFKNGFSATHNELAGHAKNDWVLYMNCSEAIDGENRILELMKYWEPENFNCYAFDHASDPHTWFRMYKKSELQWSGIIHEELEGLKHQCPWYLFRMKDTEKDMTDKFKAAVYNDIKEIVYFHLYTQLIDKPERLGATSMGWIDFARQNYSSMMNRLLAKGDRYKAFQNGDLHRYLEDVYKNKEFEQQRFESSTLIEYQGDPRYLGKTKTEA